MLKKGEFVRLSKDEFESFITKHVPEDTRKAMKKIVYPCFKYEADAVFLFVNIDKGEYKCACYMPVFISKNKLELAKQHFKGTIAGCILINPPPVVNKLTASEIKRLYNVMKDDAISIGFWRDDFAAVIFG